MGHDAAREILDRAVAEHEPSSVFALFSGGDDSLCSTAVAAGHPAFTAVVHVNTGIGVQATRRFVRETCQRQGWPLIELRPDPSLPPPQPGGVRDRTYRELVLERGFPSGPQSHNAMYYWLKQRQIRRLVAEHKTHHRDRIVLVTGIREQESERRMGQGISTEVRREGAQVWVNPVLAWSKLECLAFLRDRGIERNPVSRTLHKSGECLCGAFASPEEIELLEMFHPETAAEIHALEAEVRERGLVDCVWAAPSKAPGLTWEEWEEQTGQPSMLCRDCTVRAEAT